MDLTPISIEVNLTNALSRQNIRVDVPSRFTVGISTEPGIMNNAAERLLGLSQQEIYDLANLLGCLGIEDPQSLAGPWVQRLVQRLKRSRIYSDESWEALPDLMLAIRFAWLSEWLRKKDRSMIRMEADFMSLLLDHRQDLKSIGLGA